MRRKAGGYWTVRYIDENGMFYNVGHFGSRHAVLSAVILDTDKFPPGEGKIIFMK